MASQVEIPRAKFRNHTLDLPIVAGLIVIAIAIPGGWVAKVAFSGIAALYLVKKVKLRVAEQEAWDYRWLIRDLRDREEKLIHQLAEAEEDLERRRNVMEQELKLAREVQRKFLPTDYPHGDRLGYASYYEPSTLIGGDLYDVFSLNSRTTVFYIADATGHGVSAALVSAILKFNIERVKDSLAAATGGGSPAAEPIANSIAGLNRQMNENIRRGTFVTFIIGILDNDTGKGYFVNAGHNPPIFCRKESNHVEEIEIPPNLALGILPEFRFQATYFALDPGDKLILYTDGFNERMNRHEQEWGLHNMLHTIRGVAHKDPQTMLRAICLECNSFAQGREADDDMAMLVIERKNSREVNSQPQQ